MRLLLTTAAFGALLAASSAVPASAQQAADCGKYGMTCAPMGKKLNYTTGVQAKDCGLYGMSCAKGATTASAAPAAVTTRADLTTGRSVARTRVSTLREARVHTGAAVPTAAAPAAASIAPAPASTRIVAPGTATTVQAGYGYGPGYAYGYGYQPQYWGWGYQPAPAPLVTGRSVAVTTTAPAPAAVVAAPAMPGPVYWGGWYDPQPYGYTYAQPALWPWFW